MTAGLSDGEIWAILKDEVGIEEVGEQFGKTVESGEVAVILFRALYRIIHENNHRLDEQLRAAGIIL